MGKYAAAESTLNRLRSHQSAGTDLIRTIELSNAVNALNLERVRLSYSKKADRVPYQLSVLELLGRSSDAHSIAVRSDSERAGIAAAAGARFDPTAERTLVLAREELWLRNNPAAALARLDQHWHATPITHDIQDRIDGLQAAALYAAAGQPAQARALLAAMDKGADTIVVRSIFEHRLAALAEIALAERRFTEAMRLYRASDFAADGFPATTCAVCVLPHLARVSERAGWVDSANVFWNEYVHRPAIDRVYADQWFLATAYNRLLASAVANGDQKSVVDYRAKLALLYDNSAVTDRLNINVSTRGATHGN